MDDILQIFPQAQPAKPERSDLNHGPLGGSEEFSEKFKEHLKQAKNSSDSSQEASSKSPPSPSSESKEEPEASDLNASPTEESKEKPPPQEASSEKKESSSPSEVPQSSPHSSEVSSPLEEAPLPSFSEISDLSEEVPEEEQADLKGKKTPLEQEPQKEALVSQESQNTAPPPLPSPHQEIKEPPPSPPPSSEVSQKEKIEPLPLQEAKPKDTIPSSLTNSPSSIKEPSPSENPEQIAVQQKTLDPPPSSRRSNRPTHGISSDDPSSIIRLSEEEATKIIEELQKTAQQTQIQTPALDRLSNEVLETLKASGSKILQELKTVQWKESSSEPLIQIEKASSDPMSTEKTNSSNGLRFDHTRMEQMKDKVLQQVRMQIKVALQKNAQEVQMRLRPQYLGDVRIKLSVEQKSAQVNFLVETQTVKEMLQRSLPQLQQSMLDQGLESSEIDVQVEVSTQQGGEGEGGKAFASMDEQRAVRQWLGSFLRSELGLEEELEPLMDAEDWNEGPNQIVNIVA